MRESLISNFPITIKIATGLFLFSSIVDLIYALINNPFNSRQNFYFLFIVVEVIYFSFIVWLLYKIFKRKNWARILLSIAVLLGCLFLYQDSQIKLFEFGFASIVSFIFPLVGACLLFAPQSKGWFR